MGIVKFFDKAEENLKAVKRDRCQIDKKINK